MKLRMHWVASARWHAVDALQALGVAMQIPPGPYPDPAVPIEKWQMADAHLRAALELLSVSTGTQDAADSVARGMDIRISSCPECGGEGEIRKGVQPPAGWPICIACDGAGLITVTATKW